MTEALNIAMVERYRNSFLKEVEANVEEGEWVKMCMQCGVCSGSCPLGPFWDHPPQEIFMMIRAGNSNREMAAALGVNTRRLDRLTFAAGAALAGLAGAVMVPLMSIDPQMGLGFLVPAFLSILIGGLGSLTGALAGAGIIGGADTVFSNLWTPVVAQIVVFTLAVVVIRLFPNGIVAAWRGRR